LDSAGGHEVKIFLQLGCKTVDEHRTILQAWGKEIALLGGGGLNFILGIALFE